MSIQSKKPMVKETVGSMYYVFNTPTTNGEFDPEKYEEVVSKCNVVKNIGTTENAESVTVRASGQDYTTVNHRRRWIKPFRKNCN